jgi:hypothetical protein
MSDKSDADTSKAETSKTQSAKPLYPAEEVIERFGGIRAMANKMGIAVSTVQGWKQRRHIPENRGDAVRSAAKKHDVELEDALLKRALAGQPASADVTPKQAVPQKAAATKGAAGPSEAKVTARPSTEAKPTAEADEATKRSTAGPQQEKPASAAAPAVSQGAAAEPPQPAERGGGSFLAGMILGAVILGVGVAGAVVTRDQWLPLLDDAAAGQSRAVSELTGRIDALEETAADAAAVARLRGSLNQLSEQVERLAAADGGAAAELAGTVDRLSRRVDELASAVESGPGDEIEQEMSDLSKRIGDLGSQVSSLSESAADAEQLTALGNQVGSIEERVVSLSTRIEDIGTNRRQLARDTAADVAVALAIGELREALRLGRSFASELAALNGLLRPDSPLMTHTNTLSQYAEAGVPTRAALAQRFEIIAGDIVAASLGGDREDWVGDVLNRLGDVVSVRPVGGEVSGDDVGAIVARSEAALTAGDLDTAVSLVGKMTGKPAEIATTWLKDGRARLAAENAVSNLTIQAMETLGGRVAGTEG